MDNYNKLLAAKIDHTLLGLDATEQQLKKICSEALKYQFATVCVRVENISLVKSELASSSVKPIAVVGFPTGLESTEQKVKETIDAINFGAQEIDMVINLEMIREKKYDQALEDIKEIVKAAGSIPVKVIIEASDLEDYQKIVACTLSKLAGAAFVKTSTGFGKGGATVEDVKLMRKVVGDQLQVKASGGIRTTQDAFNMTEAGADRIGASASIAIVTGDFSAKSDY